MISRAGGHQRGMMGGGAYPLAKSPVFYKDPATGNANKLIDVSKKPGNDSGGAGAVSTGVVTGELLATIGPDPI